MKRQTGPRTGDTTAKRKPEPAPSRVAIEDVRPQIDSGRYPAKRCVGDEVVVTADIHADGHDLLNAVVRYRKVVKPAGHWLERPMEPAVNDRWTGRFVVREIGTYEYTVAAWPDRFGTWRRDLRKRMEAGQDVAADLVVGAGLLDRAGALAGGDEARRLRDWSERLREESVPVAERARLALEEARGPLLESHPDRSSGADYDRRLEVTVDPALAGAGAWYEMFPRSASPDPERHGTLRDCEQRLDYVSSMGFDVLYLPPIHPVGTTHRKGPNNVTTRKAGDPGSPWAIGSAEGGHKAIHPELGSLEDFRRLVTSARERGIEVAMDLAFQCSPDHPYVKEHPEWFRHRPDGSIQYAENPPKKYQDIYPLDFECESWRALWNELRSVVDYWIDQGVRIFRVDNPHTKPYPFWEWLITGVKRSHPEVIFLSEAFTRPKVMYRLAKLGFSQSYTYFSWRNTSWELKEYMTELTRTEVCEFFRPSFWPNTPDILTEYLQTGGRPAFLSRLVLAATLGAGYGIYGPPFELCENQPLEQGREEYLDSEKYEIRPWDLDRPDSLRHVIAKVNRIRRENPALLSNRNLEFHAVSNEQILVYSKRLEDLSNVVLVVVNLDPHHVQSGFVDLPLERLEIDSAQPYQVHDLLGEGRYMWSGPRNYVELDPEVMPAHIFRLRRPLRTERDFDY